MTAFQREREALGQRLRELRRDARLTGRQLAGALSWHPSKVSKIEAGRQTPSESDIEAWVDGCGRPKDRQTLMAALRSLDSHYLEHRRALRAGLTSLQRVFAALDADASVVRLFESAIVPGLLQTSAYASWRLRHGAAQYGASDLDEAVAARMDRQRVLYRSDKRFHFVVTEAALRYRLCPLEVMLGQLDRLVALTTVPTCRFGVIPLEVCQRKPPLHGFAVYDDRLVRAETLTAELTLEEPQEVEAYLRHFAEFAERAVYGAEARALITRIMSDLAAEIPELPDADQDAP